MAGPGRGRRPTARTHDLLTNTGAFPGPRDGPGRRASRLAAAADRRGAPAARAPGRRGGPSAARITWHSPRPFAATAVISVPGTAGHERRRFVAKRHHRAVRTATSLEAEHRFMRHLAAHGMAVPKALDDGACSAWSGGRVRLRGTGGARRARPLPRGAVVDALHLGGPRPAAGRALARLHLASETYTAPARPLEPLRASAMTSSAPPTRSATAAALAEQRPGLADFLRQRPWRRELSTAWAPPRPLLAPRRRPGALVGAQRLAPLQPPVVGGGARTPRWPGSSTSA